LLFQTDQLFKQYVRTTLFFDPKNVQNIQFAKATNIKGDKYKSLFLTTDGAEELARGNAEANVYPRFFTDNLVNLQMNSPPNTFYDSSWNVNVNNFGRPGSDHAAARIQRFQVYDGSKSVIRPSKEILPGYKAEVTSLLADNFTGAAMDKLRRALVFNRIDDRLKTLEAQTLPIRVEAIIEISLKDGMRLQ
jgi:hypothetical protein